MKHMNPLSILAWVVIFFIVLAFIAYSQGKRRGEAFQKFARQRGLSYAKKGDVNAVSAFSEYHLFAANTEKTVSNMIFGEPGSVSVSLFDYRFRTAASRSASGKSQTVAMGKSRRLTFPAFELYPQGTFHTMLSIPGKQDINFQHQKGFSERYILRSDDEGAVRSIFTDQVLSFFESHRGLTVIAQGDTLVYYRDGKLIKPGTLNSFLSDLLEMFRLFEK
ncbi:MAG: hypothetical protein JSV11_02620 [Nitrospiraceae bacterium]|nr:MAG: hypothetical protein JSV11_02620 [Nitrospiraceae bacterium]